MSHYRGEYQGAPIDMRQFRQMFVTCAALTTILLLLTYVLWFMMNGPGPSDSSEIPGMPTWQYVLFAAMALGTLPLAVWVRRSTLRPTGDFTGQKSRWSRPETFTGEDAAVMRITSAAVVGMAMPEISVLLGFVGGFMTMNWLVYAPFAAYTILGWTIMFPRPSQVRAWYARQMGYEPAPSIIS